MYSKLYIEHLMIFDDPENGWQINTKLMAIQYVMWIHKDYLKYLQKWWNLMNKNVDMKIVEYLNSTY